jgi:hypothetical protein
MVYAFVRLLLDLHPPLGRERLVHPTGRIVRRARLGGLSTPNE